MSISGRQHYQQTILILPKLLARKLLRLNAVLLVLAFSVCSAPQQPMTATTLRIAAASDLRYVLDTIARQFSALHPQVQLDIVYGSSGKLSAQIAAGAPFSVFFSADEAYITPLLQSGVAKAPATLIGLGQLVLWSKKHDVRKMALTDLKLNQLQHIAIAEPSHAPYGARSRELLQNLGIWQHLQPKMVRAENVAKAAQLADSGAVDAAIFALAIALSDDYAAGYCQLLDDKLHQPLRQVMVLTREGSTRQDALDFATFMQSASVRQLLGDFGFTHEGFKQTKVVDPGVIAPRLMQQNVNSAVFNRCQKLDPANVRS